MDDLAQHLSEFGQGSAAELEFAPNDPTAKSWILQLLGNKIVKSPCDTSGTPQRVRCACQGENEVLPQLARAGHRSYYQVGSIADEWILKYPTNPQSVAWLWDIFQRGALDLEPPYQRRSVWTLRYKQYFLDTVTLGYPAPAVFLYPEVSPEGRSVYHVVDGKQRILAVLNFIQNQYAMSEDTTLQHLRGRFFRDFSDDDKRLVWTYDFTVCNVPTADENIINNVFERINRNVARLTRQELRHAKYDGAFKRAVEALSIWSEQTLPEMPRIVQSSRLQMKDVEFVTNLCLFIEEGAASYSADDLDQAYADRDDEWDKQQDVESEYRATVETIQAIVRQESGRDLPATRLRNQADYYSLFGAVVELIRANALPQPDVAAQRLADFVAVVEDAGTRAVSKRAQDYYDAARSATNDVGPRKLRIETLRSVLLGEAEPTTA